MLFQELWDAIKMGKAEVGRFWSALELIAQM